MKERIALQCIPVCLGVTFMAATCAMHSAPGAPPFTSVAALLRCEQWWPAGMFAKQSAQSANPKVRMLAAEKRVISAEAAVQRAERDLQQAAENARSVKQEAPVRVSLPDSVCTFQHQLLTQFTIIVASLFQC